MTGALVIGGGWVFITMAAALAALPAARQLSVGRLAYLAALIWSVGCGVDGRVDTVRGSGWAESHSENSHQTT